MGMILAAVVFFSFIAWWQQNTAAFMISAGASLMAGLYWFDVYTTDVGLSISLMLIAYAFLCLGLAFRWIFWREDILEQWQSNRL